MIIFFCSEKQTILLEDKIVEYINNQKNLKLKIIEYVRDTHSIDNNTFGLNITLVSKSNPDFELELNLTTKFN